jgi:hypothetical protein
MVVTAPGTRLRPTFPLNGPAERDDAAASGALAGAAGTVEGVVHRYGSLSLQETLHPRAQSTERPQRRAKRVRCNEGLMPTANLPT